MARKSAAPAGMPAHEQAYRRMRELLLFGALEPGQPVTIQGLVEETGAGMTPVREALRRLIAEGALDMTDNRRVRVPVLTPGNIDELEHVRSALDPELARLAARRATPEDIAALRETDEALDAAILRGDVPGYLRHNYMFHERLYDIAGAPILRDLALGLWVRFGPSLRVVCGRLGTASLEDQHKALLAALEARPADGAAAAEAIRRDILQGMEQVRAHLLSPA